MGQKSLGNAGKMGNLRHDSSTILTLDGAMKLRSKRSVVDAAPTDTIRQERSTKNKFVLTNVLFHLSGLMLMFHCEYLEIATFQVTYHWQWSVSVFHDEAPLVPQFSVCIVTVLAFLVGQVPRRAGRTIAFWGGSVTRWSLSVPTMFLPGRWNPAFQKLLLPPSPGFFQHKHIFKHLPKMTWAHFCPRSSDFPDSPPFVRQKFTLSRPMTPILQSWGQAPQAESTNPQGRAMQEEFVGHGFSWKIGHLKVMDCVSLENTTWTMGGPTMGDPTIGPAHLKSHLRCWGEMLVFHMAVERSVIQNLETSGRPRKVAARRLKKVKSEKVSIRYSFQFSIQKPFDSLKAFGLRSWQVNQDHLAQRHREGTCLPCIFFMKTPSICRRGDQCTHCHLCTFEEARKRRNRISYVSWRSLRRWHFTVLVPISVSTTMVSSKKCHHMLRKSERKIGCFHFGASSTLPAQSLHPQIGPVVWGILSDFICTKVKRAISEALMLSSVVVSTTFWSFIKNQWLSIWIGLDDPQRPRL